MRLTQKKIDEVIIQVLGESGLKMVGLIKEKENVSEFDIAKKLKKDIKVVRKMLYLLYNENLVSFTRKKDKQKGWYIYYWTLVIESVRFVYLKKRREHLVRLTEELNRETNKVFFQCPQECVRLDFDDSIEFEFRCPECGKLLEQDNSAERIEILKKNILEIEKELEAAALEKKKFRAARKKAILKKDERDRIREEKRVAKELKDKEDAKQKKIDDRKKAVAERKAQRDALREKKRQEKLEAKKLVMKKKVTKKNIKSKSSPKGKKPSTKTVAKKKKIASKKVAKRKVTKKKPSTKKTISKKK
jgi:transcription initiation factor TFIIE subunit alpha